MKNPLHYITLLCFAMLMVGCQKEIETPDELTPDVTLESTERTCVADCTQCPQDFCCCRIDVLFPTMGNFDVQFCGELPGCTSTDPCTIGAMGNCPEIMGRIAEEQLIAGTSFFYCQNKDEAIRIRNLSTDDILIRVTCFDPIIDTLGTAPPFTDVFIPSSEAKSIFVNSDCEAEECN